jgi:hypothetical protein
MKGEQGDIGLTGQQGDSAFPGRRGLPGNYFCRPFF